MLPNSSSFTAGASDDSADDGNHGGSLHSGGGSPITPPSLHGLSPPSPVAPGRCEAQDDESLGTPHLNDGEGSYGVRRAPSGDTQMFQVTLQAGESLDGAGGGRADPVDSRDAFTSNGGSFVFGLEGEEPNLWNLFDQLEPLSVIVDREILDGSDASLQQQQQQQQEQPSVPQAHSTDQGWLARADAPGGSRGGCRRKSRRGGS